MKKLMSLTKLIFLSNNVYDTTFKNLYCAFFFFFLAKSQIMAMKCTVC